MTALSLIAVIDEANGLGKDNQLLCHLPNDLKHFKTLTLNKSILMGYHTFLSIGKALPKRKNIVLTGKQDLKADNIIFVDSLDKALKEASSDEVMIVGGGTLYRQTIDKAERLYITRIHHRFHADVFFPEIEETLWEKVGEQAHQKDEKHAYDYTFIDYKKRTPETP